MLAHVEQMLTYVERRTDWRREMTQSYQGSVNFGHIFKVITYVKLFELIFDWNQFDGKWK